MREDGAVTGRDNVIPWLRALLVAAVAYPVLLLIYGATIDYRLQFDDARQRLARTADLVQEQAKRVVDTHRLVLSEVDTVIGRATDAEIAARASELHAELRDLVTSLPQVDDVDIVGRDGRILVDANPNSFSVGGNFDVRAFAAAKDRRREPDAPMTLEWVKGDRFFSAAERRRGSDGAFAGLIVVSVAPMYFEQFYAGVLDSEPHRGGSIALSREGGNILARAPPIAVGATPTSPEFRRATATMPEAGYLEIPAATVDGRDRLLAYRRVGDYPLFVSATVPRNVVLGDWARTMATYLIFGVPATVGLIAITLLALRRTQAMAAEQERRLAAEAALRNAQRLEVVGQLTGGVAHDFNNLLTAILGNLDLAQASVRDGRTRRMLASAARAAERGAKLTESLLAFSRRQRLATEIVDAHALLGDLAGLVRRTLPETVTVRLALDPAPLHCRADAGQLESALLNLVINARDAMAEKGGTLTLSTARRVLTAADLADNAEARPGAFICIAVADTGSGMTQAVLERAFEPFFTTKEVGKGSGLGLSQVYGFVRQLGGHVTIESRSGDGSTVRLFLPAAETPTAKSEKAAAATPSPGGATVMVVEDDPDVREVTRETLANAGFRVVTAADGRAAHAMLEQGETIDLLLSDVVMPSGISGPELARLARGLRPGLPVLLTSGYAAAALSAHGGADGEFAVIGKPFRAKDLIDRISTALGRETRDPPGAVT